MILFLADVLAEKYGFERSEITMESGLRELGLDSLDVIDILVELEEQIGKEIELEQKVETVGELVQYIEKKNVRKMNKYGIFVLSTKLFESKGV